MQSILLMLLILVPAPKNEQPKPIPFCGVWSFTWGGPGCEQTTHFYRDGTCWSPQFGSGTWSEFEGAIWFTEQSDTIQYVMVIDLVSGEGQGNRVDDDGCFGPPVPVLIRRGERLPMPREK